MKFSTLLTGSLFATAALAAPLTEKRRAARAAKSRHSNPPYKAGTDKEILKLTNTTNVEYSSNWAGAVLIGTGYTKVTGEFTVPSVSAGSSSSSSGYGDYGYGYYKNKRQSTEYCASAWVGIDGDTCETAILQTGLDFCYEDGEVSYDAWYEWYPDYAYDFDSISFSEGDSVKVTVEASSDSTGTATVENLTTGESVTHSFSGNVEGDLCEYNAEWIVEDFESGDSLVAFADFGTVTFTNAEATSDGSTVGPSDATIMDIEQDSTVLTSTSVDGDTVTITYV
ncbi:proteinase aspergillopepsin II [Aspergillus sclerotioniger CBS 115572]|uniref:Proteinase aspergillopepsin II n=1 Tax=Aspergillus sclerotioniger CBS 115572 TaxID=1450535 RepID=A0A317XHP0_9EURO|nr:proteinase aspergillopepsin II [Aspergillus sclerotioniger CBS 115572]PWY96750.1 proteinase aspergillopepsin II [Aspergillus sclerotioniger CBS 115572]